MIHKRVVLSGYVIFLASVVLWGSTGPVGKLAAQSVVKHKNEQPVAQEGFAVNQSTKTKDAEEDNINIPLFRPGVKKFRITATPPKYAIGEDNCKPDFSATPPASKESTPRQPDVCTKVFDDGKTVLEVCVVDKWWRGTDMQVVTAEKVVRGHYIRVYRKVADENSWPQFLVLYQDGNLRLKSHPPKGRKDVCFGSSVVVGPAQPGKRPLVEIKQVVFISSEEVLDLFLFYAEDLGAVHLTATVNREAGVVTAENVRYHCSDKIPFATFRSMWVADGNSDVDRIETGICTLPILGAWNRLAGNTWFFHRGVRSKHNTSAPDIKIEVLE